MFSYNNMRVKLSYTLQIRLEADKYVTSSLVIPMIEDLREELSDARDRLEELLLAVGRSSCSFDLTSIVQTMIDDFEDRWGNGSSVLEFKYGHHGTGKGQPCGYKREQILAFTLDPRMVALESVKEEEEDKVWKVLQDRLEEFLKENDQTSDKATKAPGAVDAAAQQPSCTAGTSSGSRAKKRAKKAPKTGLIQARADGDARGRAERELLEFREFAGIQMETGELTDDATTDPLKWWKKWGSKFPNLAQLARRYLAMPATSAPVERLFSVAGLVATAKRSRLAPSTVSLLVFLHEALPISRGLEVDSMLKSLDHDSDDSDEVMMMDES